MPDEPNPGPGRLGPPRKRFGQHFLTDPRALDRIVDAAGIDRESCVVEIGPGRGALTERLVGRAGRVIAVEIDRDLARHLREKYASRPDVRIVEADALDVDWAELAKAPYRLLGNLPYYITTPLIFRILEPPRPERAVILVQREVANRLVASAGADEYGALSVNVQVVARAAIVGKVPAGAFHPRPAVDSAIVALDPLQGPLVEPNEEDPFRRFVQAVFGMRRKQMIRVIRELALPDAYLAGEVLEGLGIPAAARPETLTPADFVRLFRALPRASKT